MRMKKRRQFICLLLLAVLFAGMALPVQAKSDETVRVILTEMGQLVSVQQTPYLLAKERNGTLWGLYNTDGEELIPYTYAALSFLSYGCFDAGQYQNEKLKTSDEAFWEKTNSHALVTADGTQVSDFQYGVFQVYNTYWACGWVLESGSEEDHDYQSDSSYYCIKRCDLFYLGDHALRGVKGTEALPQPVSLTREEFKNAKGHGKYLYVQDRQGMIKAYDSALRLMSISVKKLDDPMYIVKNWAVKANGKNEILIDGISAVTEMPTVAGLYLKVTRLDYSGVKWNSVFTVEGEQLMPFIEEDVSSVTEDYAVLTSNKKQGLYSFREKRQLLSCTFDKLISNPASLDPYVLHGYVCAERDGTRYYIHINDGTIIEAAKLNKKWVRIGNTYVMNDSANLRYRVLSPDQKESYVDDSKFDKNNNRGSGYLLAFKSDVYSNILVTWYGERLLTFNYRPLIITDDDRVIAETGKEGFKLLEVITE